jgi:FkbM family methyltransferase
VTATHTSDVNRVLLRAWRFLQKPWNEKANRWNRLLPNIPFPIRLPSGALWLLRKDNLGEPLLAGTFESAELAFVERFLRPGMTMLDLGAHHGLYTLLASKRVGPRGKVIAFEPSPRERRALLLHLILNRCTNAKVQGLAVGNENTEATLFVVEGTQTGCNSFRPPDVLSGTFPARVRVVRIDDWLDKQRVGQIDFIKLDVEGAELEALKGASRLLERQPRPVILAEVQDVRTIPWGYRAKEILLHLHEKGFRWFKPLSDGSLMRMLDDSAEYEGNFIAVPAERMDQVTSAWAQPYETLRKKWVEVPTTALGPYVKTTDLLNLPDD